MGRKAKEEAQQKIGNLTKTHRNVSKTASTKENANTSNDENRAPLQTQSQNAMNSKKNRSVRFENLNTDPMTSESIKRVTRNTKTTDPKAIDKLVSPPSKPFAAVEKIFKKDKATDTEHVYDYTFDSDAIPLETENGMKDLLDKLAKENKIEVKKYRAKGVKKQTAKKQPTKNSEAQKRRRDKQPTENEPPRKKPNLKNKKVNNNDVAAAADTIKANSNIEKNNNVKKMANTEKLTPNPNILSCPNQSLNNDSLDQISREDFVNRRLRNIMQSTPKTSTPLRTNAAQSSNFNGESPLPSVSGPNVPSLAKQRLQLSIAEESMGTNHVSANDNDAASFVDFNDDDFPLPEVTTNRDKENSLRIRGKNTGVNHPKNADSSLRLFSPTKRRVYERSPLKNITSEVNNSGLDSVRPNSNANFDSFGFLVESRSGQTSLTSNMSKNSTNTKSAMVSDRNRNRNAQNEPQPSTSKGLINGSSGMSSSKYRVYGRSPMKNISSGENESDLRSNVDSFGPVPHLRSMQSPQKSTSNLQQFTLPEAEYLLPRCPSPVPSEISEDLSVENCFGFDDDEDFDESQVGGECANETEKPTISTVGLKTIREKLKRYLHNPDAAASSPSKKKKTSNKQNKTKTPVKNAPNVPIFTDPNAKKQKDIRSALAPKVNDKDKANKSNEIVPLFEEPETVQDRRKSYSRPIKHRKRNISIDSEPEESSDEDDDDNDEDFNGSGKKSKPKRRKKMDSAAPKVNPELDEFAKELNSHFAEIENFEMVVE